MALFGKVKQTSNTLKSNNRAVGSVCSMPVRRPGPEGHLKDPRRENTDRKKASNSQEGLAPAVGEPWPGRREFDPSRIFLVLWAVRKNVAKKWEGLLVAPWAQTRKRSVHRCVTQTALSCPSALGPAG